jgi:membrane-associated phospholipid phosphatase
MNRYFKYIGMLIFIALIGCDNEIPELNQLPVLQPISEDENAGNWQTVLNEDYFSNLSIKNPSEFTTVELNEEEEELINATQNRTSAQTEKANFWSAGGVLRWNQIARELVIKYNVAPDVGTPPDPQNPFANPPFAARAYALLSVAQHDALIVNWHYKHEFMRANPSDRIEGVNALFPNTSLPSYPSEQATIAQVSFEILSYLFPRERDYLAEKANEHIRSTIWSGKAGALDILAGKEIADVVLNSVKEYAKNDRMNNAHDPENQHLSYFNIPSRIETPWECIQLPLRKPMLPFYGLVKSWYDSTTIFQNAPEAPPAIDSEEFQQDLQNVRAISDNRTREQWRISEFWADGGGTYTPPGHWNQIAEGLIADAKWSEVRTARAYSLMNRAIMDAGIISWWSKFYYYLPRPAQLDPKITVATGIPNFPSYTSGHSTFSSAAGTVLGHLFPSKKQGLREMYIEAGISRVYGGIHYNVDNIAGRLSGESVGQLANEWAEMDGSE